MDQENALTVACLRCRKQRVLTPHRQLRCTRERPVCRRCQRVRAECSYPRPPDRKRLAVARVQSRNLEAGNQGGAAPALRPEGSPAAAPGTNQFDDRQPTPGVTGEGHSPACSPHRGTRSGDGFSGISRTGVAVGVAADGQLDMSSSPSLAGAPASRNVHLSDISVSREVASFLFEIYFERHYQAHLLFFKDDLIRDYHAGHVPGHVSLAIFAFAAMFLPSVPGGSSQGTIDISAISRVEWFTVGHLWANSASQQALTNADKPSLDLIQACQVLCLVWFARGQSTRTNMHAAIAYRGSQLLQLEQAPTPMTADWSRQRQRQLGVRCFWACWLTRCASQENARFEKDCWSDVAGLPLPIDFADPHGSDAASSPYLDEKGLLRSPGEAQQGQSLGFHALLVIVQGLWWEIQQFSRTVRTNTGSPTQWTSTFLALDKKLEDLSGSVPVYTRQSWNVDVPLAPNLIGQGRLFSLTYLYHLCVIYLHSSVVPLLSCSPQVPDMSQSLIRFAADKAWEHSTTMTIMTDQFLSDKTAVSTLWPIVGYGAYVCAAIQMRRLLALKCLSRQQLNRIKIHLSITRDLKEYWMTLEPLHQDMERQFSLAQRFTSEEIQCTADASISRLVASPNTGLSPEFSHHLRTYVQNDDSPKTNEGRVMCTPRAADGRPNTSQGLNPQSTPADSRDTQTAPAADDIENADIGGEAVGDFPDGGVSLVGVGSTWWNQDVGSLAEIFGTGIYPQDNYGYNMDKL